MSDQPEHDEEITEVIQPTTIAEIDPQPVQPQLRVFKTGATRIVEDASMQGMTVAQVQATLKSAYPEIANATVRESVNADGQQIVEFLPVAGRKG